MEDEEIISMDVDYSHPMGDELGHNECTLDNLNIKEKMPLVIIC